MREVAAIILAAGRSERMGAFKPLLPFGASTVIEACINYLLEASVESIVVVAGYKADELKSVLLNRTVDVVVNPLAHSQMNSSISSGIRAVPADARAVLIALADHPAVSPDVVKELIACWKGGESILKPTWNDRGGHPVLIDLQFRHDLENLDDKQGLKGFFQTHQRLVKRLPVSSPYVARDMDTWDDYLTLHKDVFGSEPTAGRD